MEYTLACLEKGAAATVAEVRDAGPLGRRLLDLGLIPGAAVECLGRAPLGDPAAYLIAGAVIAIRRRDAESVLLERERREDV
ncbi:MAG: ferrous iron transport protein A [Firmicutes bacterium]|nr:ferrous iron transport protein A [Bacillota bacterium]